ncbi:MAG: hypothetical protein WBS19_15065 [Candidatus Korobacteraceae bacterium]
MTARISRNVHAWLVDPSIVTIMGCTMPPREPSQHDEEEQDDGDAKPDDELEPAVIREPDE